GGPGSASRGGWDAQVRDRYRRLLECLDVTVTVDVLAGTSAGGINAALLGLSSAAGADLAQLRDLWLTTGSMDLLLRDPGERNPPSLMQGDKVLFSHLARGIQGFWDQRPDAGESPAPAEPPDTTVFITTTMMSGETSRFTDDYGTVVPDVDHHGLFTFHQQDLAPGPRNRSSLAALALAARCSASFPGAFEPSFVPIHGSVTGVTGVPLRPDMADFANMTRSHWVADGGLLANRPIAPLLSTVFSRQATREVRRVLAFVVPDGGVTAHAGQSPPADQWAKPPTMVEALKMDLDAQLSQSIASELQLIRAHNDQLSAAGDLRRGLAELGARLPAGGLVTPGLLIDYQVQQGMSLARPLLDKIMRQVSALEHLPHGWDTTEPASLSAATPEQEQLTTAMATILGAGWNPAPVPAASAAPVPAASAAPVPAASAAPAGTAEDAPEAVPAEQGAGELLRDQKTAWDAWSSESDPVQAAWFGLPALRGAQTTVLQLIRLGYQRATDKAQRQLLNLRHAQITAAVQGLPAGPDDGAGVTRAVREGAEQGGGHPPATLAELAIGLAEEKRQALLIGPGGPALLAGAWEKLAAVAMDLVRDLAPLAVPEGRKSRREAAQALRTYRAYLAQAGDAATMTGRLLNLTMAERALQPAQPVIDQPVEFIQVSANTRTLLSPQQDTVNKLRGVELHHFAAFYKSSWRAYDWMWGRLDGNGWLVHILLDPRRILAVIENRYDWPRPQRARNFAALLRQAAGLPDRLPGDCLERELDFLNHEDATIPVSLPSSALFLARAWQEPIAANELPAIAERMVADDRRLPPTASPSGASPSGASPSGASPPAASPPVPGGMAARVRGRWHRSAARRRENQPLPKPVDPWVTTVLDLKDTSHAQDLAALLPACPVRQETLAGEEHTPAFLQTATKAAAVATAALTVAPEVPKPIRPILTSARAVTRTGYLATKALGGNGLKTLLAGLALAIVGIVLATQGTVIVGLTGTVLALAGLYLMALGAWGIHRGLLGALIAFTALLAVGALTLPWVRTELWGKNGSSKDGLVPRDVLPWLRGTWWAGLTVLGGIILLAVLLSVLPRSRAPRNSGQETPTGSLPPVGLNRMEPQPPGGIAPGVDGSPAADQGSPPADRDPALR
ncbi:MAG: patatin-like protein, partial [Streptosporangiaceae bacterium]